MPQERYSPVAITLHWIVAILLGVMIALGQNMHDRAGRPIEWMFQLHKSVGITILVLMIARFVWRFWNKPPALPADMKPLEKHASHWVHIGLYTIVFLLPITGWIMVSVSPFSIATVLYGTIAWPHLPGLSGLALETRETIHPVMEEVHELMTWALYGLFALHVIGAIKHEMSDDEGVLKRMIPGLFGKTTAPRAPSRGALSAFGSALLFFGIIAGGPVIAQAVRAGPAQSTPVSSAGNWLIDYENSEISFSGMHDGDDFAGRFEDWQAVINWSDEGLEKNLVTVTVKTGSAKTGTALYDNTLDAAEWFNTDAFPDALVTLSSFTKEADAYTGNAEMTLKDTVHSTPFTFTLVYEGEDATMVGTTKISREMFDLGQESDAGGDWVSLDVDVSVRVKASRIPG